MKGNSTPEEWLRFSKGDLQVALLIMNESEMFEYAIFHCHEAAEKAIKSLLIFQKCEYPRVHDLENLIDMLQINKTDLQILLMAPCSMGSWRWDMEP